MLEVLELHRERGTMMKRLISKKRLDELLSKFAKQIGTTTEYIQEVEGRFVYVKGAWTLDKNSRGYQVKEVVNEKGDVRPVFRSSYVSSKRMYEELVFGILLLKFLEHRSLLSKSTPSSDAHETASE